MTRGKAGYVDTDTSRFVNTVEGVCTCSLLTASILSVKKDAKSAVEKECWNFEEREDIKQPSRRA